MENGYNKWVSVEKREEEESLTVRDVLRKLMENIKVNENSPTIHLGHGDPSSFPCFQTTPIAQEAIVKALNSSKLNCYAPAGGILPARKSVAEYLSKDLPYKLSSDDIFLTVGANHGIEILITAFAKPGGNILFPRPGYPLYEARAKFSKLEIRHFDLLPNKEWEVDIENVEALADEKTVAIVVINPGNPCGNVFSYQHLQKVVQTARKLGIIVIADEVYNHLSFGSKPFVPIGVFGSIAPVITLGTISKRWIVPGWRLGWIALTDNTGILHKSGIVESIKSYLNITADPVTFIQGALPEILEKTNDSFFTKIISTLRADADTFYDKVKEIPCISCPHKPEGAMSAMVKLYVAVLEDINDDMEFCIKLAKEESVILLPGVAVGLKNWLRITFAVEPAILEDGLERIKAFCLRHAK